MYNTFKSENGDLFISEGGKLSDIAISNMISVLTNNELSRLFTYEETEMIKMAIKTNIASLAASTISKIKPEMINTELENDEIGKKFR